MNVIQKMLFDKCSENPSLRSLTVEQVSDVASIVKSMYRCYECLGSGGKYVNAEWVKCSNCEGYGYMLPSGAASQATVLENLRLTQKAAQPLRAVDGGDAGDLKGSGE